MRFTLGWGTIFKSIFLFGLISSLSTCKKKESYEHLKISVHAASGLYNPRSMFIDNTVEAVEYALEFEDLNGIEIDIQYSKDSTLWMFHDDLLQNRTKGKGAICERVDHYLDEIEYKVISSVRLSKFSDVDWSLVKG